MRLNAWCRRTTSSLSAEMADERVPRLGELDALHRVDDRLQRLEASAQDDPVDEDGREDRGDQHERLAPLPASSKRRRATARPPGRWP